MNGRHHHAAGALIVGLLLLANLTSQAQVVLDGTLRPTNAGQAPPNLALPGQPADYEIDDDLGIITSNGENLLHSFSEFSLADGERATFTGDPTILNVIARVTGGPSVIEGVLASEVGQADFFFLNPAGITFRNAEPDTPVDKIAVPGSFFASTADALIFEGGERFEADGTPATLPDEILSMPSEWEFSDGAAARIAVDQTLDLRVPDGEILSLVAGDIDVTRAATVRARTGSIEIAAVGGDAALVPLDLATWVRPDTPLGEVRLSEGSTLTVQDVALDGVPGGRIVLRGGRLVIDEGTALRATGDAATGRAAIDISFSDEILIDEADLVVDERGAAGAGAISIAGDTIEVGGESLIRSRSFEDADPISIDATSIALRGLSTIVSEVTTGEGAAIDIRSAATQLEGGSSISSRTFSSGDAGSIRIATDNFVADGPGTSVSSATSGAVTSLTGNAGDVTIARSLDGLTRADSVTLRGGAEVEAATVTEGDAGTIRIAADRVSIEGGGTAPDGTVLQTGLFARSGRSDADAAARGNGGQIRIDAQEVRVSGSSGISARSFGSGGSGTIEIVADESVLLHGDSSGAPSVSAFSEDGDSLAIAANMPAIQVTTGRLELIDGATIDTDALAAGAAGDVNIDVSSLLVRGTDGVSPSGISAQSSGAGVDPGDGGSITIVATDRVEVLDGGSISVRSRGAGASGSIRIQADDDLTVSSGASIRSTAEGRGAAGDLTLIAGESVSITAGSSIASESTASADAGALSITANDNLIVSRSQIDATARSAAGANITLAAGNSALIEQSRVEASVEGRAGEGDAGNLAVQSSDLTINASDLLARATLGDGGRIDLRANRFLASADSLIDASSTAGIDGVVQIEAPVTNLRGELTRLPDRIVDPGRLLSTPCAARVQSAGSFVVSQSEGLSQTPLVGRSLPLPIPRPGTTPTTGDEDEGQGASDHEVAAPVWGAIDSSIWTLDGCLSSAVTF